MWTAADEASNNLWIPNRTQTTFIRDLIHWSSYYCNNAPPVSSVLKWMYTNTHSSELFFIHSGADVLQVMCMLNNVNTVLVAWSEIRAWLIELNELNTTKHVLSLKGRLMSTSLKQRSMLLVKHLWKYKTLWLTLCIMFIFCIALKAAL